jgi:hypothetical protein
MTQNFTHNPFRFLNSIFSETQDEFESNLFISLPLNKNIYESIFEV